MRLLLLLALTLNLAHCSCPTGFELVNGNECRGNYTRIDASWGDTLTKCSEILGTAPIIHSQKDQDYWAGRVKNSPTWTVLGFSCNTTSKRWEWVDGTILDYKPGNYHSGLDQECVSNYADYVGLIRNSDGRWSFGRNSVDQEDVFCSTPLRQPLPSDDGCDNFDVNSVDGVCYQVASTAENWKEAQIICGSFGATVASVHNVQENSFIRRLAVSKGAIGGMFLGATLTGKGREFGWLDGTTWDYDNFYPGFPMTSMGDCVMMDTGGTAGEWANVDCDTKLAVACMRQQHYSQPACSSGPFVEGQVLYSPGFPFDASTPCDFILSVDVGKKVELEVLFVEANPCCDHLVVYENYFGANIIANLTGQINGTTTYRTSSSNFMRVSWQPIGGGNIKGGENVRGAMFTYRAV